MSLQVSVFEQGARVPQSRGLASWLVRNAPKSARGAVTIAIVADAKMRALNRQFRKKDAVTDVLSFPFSPKPLALSPFLGDIVIAKGVARRQARGLGHSFGVELRILALHGLLHLLGYDHEVDGGQMARVERRLRRRAGLPGGLIDRSS